MAKFCGKCGAAIADDALVCGFRGANAMMQAAAQHRPVTHRLRTDKRKKAD